MLAMASCNTTTELRRRHKGAVRRTHPVTSLMQLGAALLLLLGVAHMAAAAPTPAPATTPRSTSAAGSPTALPGSSDLVLPAAAVPSNLAPVVVPQGPAATLSPTNRTTAALNASLAAAALTSPLNATSALGAAAAAGGDPHLAAAAAAAALLEPVDLHPAAPGTLAPARPRASTATPAGAATTAGAAIGAVPGAAGAATATAAGASASGVAASRPSTSATQYPAAAPLPAKPSISRNGTVKVVPAAVNPRPAVKVAPVQAPNATQGAGSRNRSSGGGAGRGDPNVLTILHFNDWHQRMEPMTDYAHSLCDRNQADKGRCGGGIARMKTIIDQERDQDPDLLLLNAGDDFIGTIWDHKYGSKAAAHFMNQLEPDAMTIGNHEFDWGADSLGNYLRSLEYPVLGACNLDFKGHWVGQHTRSWVTKTVKGHKVCIFGLTTTAAPTKQMSPVWVKDPYSSGRDCIKALQQAEPDCDFTILLSHLGYTADVYAAKLISGVDLIIGGHSHSFLWADKTNPPEYDKAGGQSDYVWGPYPTWVDVGGGRKLPVVQAGWGSRYMGKLRLVFDPSSGKVTGVSGSPILLGAADSDNPVEEDPHMKKEVAAWKYW